MEIIEKSQNHYVTAVISHYIRPGRESGYEEWMKDISQTARQFAGYQGVTILRPQPGTRAEYVIISRFDNYDNLSHWLRSPERKEWIERSKPLVHKPENVKVLSGLEALVSLPDTASTPPPRYKTAIVTWIGVFFCVSTVIYFLGPYFAPLPFLLNQAIVNAIIVVLLVYLIMPGLTRLFYNWLH